MRPGLILDRVSLGLAGREPLIRDLSLAAAPGEIVTLMGPSGSGKSSLLAWLTGTLGTVFRADGRVWVDGAEVTRLPPERRRIGILFQDDLLFPHMTVAENLAYALPRAVSDRRARRDRNGRAARVTRAAAPARVDRRCFRCDARDARLPRFRGAGCEARAPAAQ